MPVSYSQKERRLSVSTPLGDDVLLLTQFTGHEELSRLFSYQLEMFSEDNAIVPRDIVGKNVTITVKNPDDTPRFFNGFVSKFSYSGTDERLSRYSAEVVPWLWFLTMTRDCRIFQEMTVKDIIEQIFGDLGFSDFETGGIQGTHPTWEYCVQYRETDFDFVSRLMEKEGIFYFFRQDDGVHTMVLADQTGAYETCPEKEANFSSSLSARELTEITSWEHRYEFRPGKWAQTDYNFKTPGTSLLTNTNTLVSLDTIDKYEVYEYPGIYKDKGEGETEVKIRMEEEEAHHDTVVATSTCRTFTPGGKFTIGRHEQSPGEEGKGYVITAIQHSVSLTGAYISGGTPGDLDYTNNFTCIPEGTAFRPPRTTSKPTINGAQTAVVTGPAGEEIYPDEFGRVKVQFHWDREGKKDENTSCWTRVAQPWAGENWGFICTPRIGHEVVVSFLEGDPDRPLITGSVYHAELMPPYELPANKTQSGIKSRSSKGGGPDNFNEIRFEDKKGEEQLFIHAEKNQDIEVENDESHWVGHDQALTVDNDQSITVKHDRTEVVDNDRSLTVGHDKTESVKNNKNVDVAKDLTEKVGGNETLTVDKDRTRVVGGGESVSIDKDQGINVKKNQTLSVGENLTEDVGKDSTATVGKKFVVDAGDEVVLQAGDASIILKKNGDIFIKGKKINVKGSGDIIMKGSKIKQN